MKYFISDIILIFVVFTAFKCEGNIPYRAAAARPDMVVSNFKTINYEHGKTLWELNAVKSSYFYNEKRSIAYNVILKYFKNDKNTTTVKSDQAIMNTETKDIDLIGNVDIKSTSGNRLLTTRIKWYNNENYLDTDDPVKIIRKNGDIIKGDGLRADYNLEDYEIKKNVFVITTNMEEGFKKQFKNEEKSKK